jgi:hypothetical protein
LGAVFVADAEDPKEIAARLMSEAWSEAVAQGVDSELVASTALTAALASLVQSHGREGAVRIAERLIDAVRSGRFDRHTPSDDALH